MEGPFWGGRADVVPRFAVAAFAGVLTDVEVFAVAGTLEEPGVALGVGAVLGTGFTRGELFEAGISLLGGVGLVLEVAPFLGARGEAGVFDLE